ncbi:DNA polymerase III subunit gamma/tau [Cellvibrio zantedeschiae]|uniref:DNA polymerase III subunit gamma/tau n=1 Tax=Cellvibrio zantedeschiae TaxID=1237077 RepID=A0ABQ3ASS7_9GAMM|nr:DNA polymerase III subunit gamma/tau [Cellvibrio zantedeschiae]GGY65516.1 DNA polymerase III subunit gamma/tau [Cellvibrio zantedeschiae]
MSYQVLARKWRPRIFREMVGQEHVLQALINALDHNRLHHAYLFTGTRGVGKTTIARILAKCLNCETGVSSEPCGTCSACREIAEGRFVDLIEVDAASRTKVEDTRELLENVQYAPTRGRYKVYLIDEVHMLSNSSFNALLKTLEEPPPHVKFLLATTDPQKLPMTILSRCLQFNLKNMTPERIVNHLKFVLEQEVIPFEESALWLLGRAADGSMRDALSLTDQSISYGSGKITQAEVAAMLGTLDQAAVYEIVNALASLDGKAVLGAVQNMAEQAPDYANALAEMLSVLHRIAIAQALPEAVDNSHGDKERIMQLAQQLPAEDVQLFYQTALLGRRDLPLAPDARAGFEMVLLRMLAFKPQGVIDVPTQSLPQSSAQARPAPAVVAAQANVSPAAVAPQVAPVQAAPQSVQTAPSAAPVPVSAPSQTPPPFDGPYDNAPEISGDEYDEYSDAPAYLDAGDYGSVNEVPEPKKSETPETQAAVIIETKPEIIAPPPAREVIQPLAPELPPVTAKAVRKVPYEQASPQDWPEIYLGLGVTGILQSTVANCQLVARNGNEFQFIVDENNSTLYDPSHQQRLADLLSNYFIERVHVKIQPGKLTAETPALIAKRHQEERYANAVNAIKTDPIVQQLIEHFGATLREDTIQAI